MYDKITRTIIEQAIPLKGLDMERLSQELTKAYAKIVSYKVSKEEIDDLDSEIEEIERIGRTYLALLLSGQKDDIQPIAFVAASAYALVASHHELQKGSIFSRDSVCPLCASILLYIVADAVSDAMEIAAKISDADNSESLHDNLSQFIRHLSQGKLRQVVQSEIPVPSDKEMGALATSILYTKCLRGIQKICSALLAEGSVTFDDVLNDFLEVKELSVEDLEQALDGTPIATGTYSTFPGPFVLSSLLHLSMASLKRHALISIQAPDEQFADQWISEIKSLAQTRPYIWPNHLRAIARGILKPGVSGVFSLPTGSGKTTLSNLKIISTLIAGGKVIFLAPTHALVQQISNDIKKTFQNREIKNMFLDGEYTEVEDIVLPDITVMTPERCLAILMFCPEAFRQVKLVVFDECHVLNAGEWDNSYRACDSMMCLHRIFEHAPQSDFFLLSAMVENAVDIAGWIEERTERPCLAILDEWKPTRQAKGCIVFQQSDVKGLEDILRADRNDNTRGVKRKSPSSKAVNRLDIKPWILFGLNQTWNTRHVADYVALPISQKTVRLSANKSWRLTPNKNAVAASIAKDFCDAHIKSLIFVHVVSHTESIAKQVAGVQKPVTLTPSEGDLLAFVEEELGDIGKSYVPTQGDAACHHGLLLKEERELVESLFRRPDGISILVATPTVAQGMNLPAEAVILAGDERWDGKGSGPSVLDAHELLNAAGRAGRAGHNAKGIVLVIPSDIVSLEYTDEKAEIGNEWMAIQERTFSKSDQCLTVIDPLEKILDIVEDGILSSDATSLYLLRRMPYRSEREDTENIRDTSNKSLAAFVAKRKGTIANFNKLAEKTIQAGSEIRQFENLLDSSWLGILATEIGVNIGYLKAIYDRLNELDTNLTVNGYLDWANELGLIALLVKPSSNDAIVQALSAKEEQEHPEEASKKAYGRLSSGIKSWCGGETLVGISKHMLETTKTAPWCVNSRKLAMRWVPEVSFALGAIARIYKYKCDQEGGKMPLVLGTIASQIRHGVNLPEKLAILHVHNYQLSRPRVNSMYDEIVDQIPFFDTYASFREVLAAVGALYK